MVPCAVITTTHASPRISRRRPSAVRPSTPGMRMSRNTTSNGSASKAWSAAVPSLTARTSYPAWRSPFSSTQRRLSSSSATRMRAITVAMASRPSLRDRKKARHARSAPFGALHLDRAAVLLENAVADRESEPEPLVLGREERIEDSRADGVRDPRALVGDLHLDHAALPPAEVHLAEERVQAHVRRQGEAPTALHRVQAVAHEVVEDLQQPVLVAEDRRQARVVAADQGDSALTRALLVQQGDALEELMEIERHRAKLDRPRQIQQHLDDAVHAVDLGQEHVRVLPQPRIGPELSPEQLHRTPDRAERIAHLVGEPDRHATGGRQGLAAAHFGLELMDPREVSQHHHGGLDLSVAAAQRSGHDRDGHASAVTALDEALGLRAALAGGEGLAEPPHDRGVRREDFLDVTPLGAARRALGEHLGRGVPEDDPELGVDRDHRVGKTREDRLVVHWSEVREAGLNRGWPKKGASRLRRALSARVIRLCPRRAFITQAGGRARRSWSGARVPPPPAGPCPPR